MHGVEPNLPLGMHGFFSLAKRTIHDFSYYVMHVAPAANHITRFHIDSLSSFWLAELYAVFSTICP